MFKLLIALAMFFLTTALFSFGDENRVHNKVFKSASELDYPPFSIVTKDGKADGFSVELLKASLNVMDGEVTFYVGAWNKLKADLKDGKIDVLPVVGRTKEREKYYDFTIPYLTMHGAVFTRENYSAIKTASDIAGKELVVMKGDNANEYLVHKQVTKKIITFASYEEAFKALSSGKHDAIVIQKLVGVQLLKKLKIKNIKVSKFILSDFQQNFAFAVKEGDKELLSLLNEGLSIVIANGTYREIYQKWFYDLDLENNNYKLIIKILIATLLMLFIVIVLIYFWNKSLKEKVNEKTKALDLANADLKHKVNEAIKVLKKQDEMMIAQSRQAAMGEMISMIAHQWRQPLSIISMSVNNMLLEAELEGLSEESIEKELNGILKQSEHLSKTIDDFGNFFRPNREKEEIVLKSAIKDTIDIIGDSIKNNNISLTVNNHVDISFVGHKRELIQVVMNLLSNAKDAVLEHLKVDRKIEISTNKYGENIIIKVCNNGACINEDMLVKIFEPYFTTKTEKNGTGLGLYMSKTIIEKHFLGNISVENHAEGVCFIVSIPAEQSLK